MGLKQDILDKVKDIVNTKFTPEEVKYVPDISNTKLTFGNTGLIFESTVLYIDIRGSTEILNSFNKSTVAKIHKAYYHTIVKIANDTEGEVRSFNGDSLLVFYQGTTKLILLTAVRAAMHMKYMLDNDDGIKKYLKKYTSIDFGIGIDDGKILCTKVGIGGTNDNKDLFWISNAVNKSTVLSDLAKSPNHIYISNYIYSNLTDAVKYVEKKDALGNTYKHDIWNKKQFTYNGKYESCYYTSYYWTF